MNSSKITMAVSDKRYNMCYEEAKLHLLFRRTTPNYAEEKVGVTGNFHSVFFVLL